MLLVMGCAAPLGQNQSSTQQILSRIEQNPLQNNLQDKINIQLSKTTSKAYTDYKVGPEDLLEVVFLGSDELGRSVRVNGQGYIALPLVGSVKVGGLSPQEIEKRLTELYRDNKFINNPQITLFVKEYRHQRVMVTGAVAQPGSYEVIGPRSLLEMVGKAGGLTEKAGDVVHIIRNQSASDSAKPARSESLKSFAPGTETIVIDLRRLLMEGSQGLNLPIKNGDVVYVPYARMAYVLGAVKKPGQVPVKENLTVSQAIALTEGIDPMLASNDVTILRVAGDQRNAININLTQVNKGLEPDPVLQPSDVVIVSESGFRRMLYNFKNLLPGGLSLGYSIIP
jgi:polysaccharide biosynthesis/export protein